MAMEVVEGLPGKAVGNQRSLGGAGEINPFFVSGLIGLGLPP